MESSSLLFSWLPCASTSLGSLYRIRVLTLSGAFKSPRQMMKTVDCLHPTLRDSDLGSLGWGLESCISKKQSQWVWCQKHRDHILKSTDFGVTSNSPTLHYPFCQLSPVILLSLSDTALNAHSPSLLIFLPLLLTSPECPFPLPPGIPTCFFKIYIQYFLLYPDRSQSLSVLWMNKWMNESTTTYQTLAKGLNMCNLIYF